MRGLIALLTLFLLCGVARANDKIDFGLDWTAEAEYGGFYQALANGIYAKHGLDVTIHQGGPQVNHTQLLLAGRLDLTLTGNSFLAMNFVQQNLPFRVIAAIFQKDPSVLIAHPGMDNDSFAALKGKPIMISADTRVSWWNFLKAKFGYSDSQIRPYTFNLGPFLNDPKAIQQGYLGSEPFSIKQEAHFDPVVLLVADAGFSGYASLIAVSDKMIAGKADVIQRFMDASVEGWQAYLHGDPAPANALIKKDNPQMNDALIAYGIASMKDHGIVESGDAAKQGIGAMSPERWTAFYQAAAEEGVYPKGLDVTKAYTLQFVNHGH
jgi:NitT/TauT family transport system substrate-binding protein